MRHATERAWKIIRGRLPNNRETLLRLGASTRFACGKAPVAFRDLTENFIDEDAFEAIGDGGAQSIPGRATVSFPDCPKCRVAIDHALEFPDADPLKFDGEVTP